MEERMNPLSEPYEAEVELELAKLMPPGVPPLRLFRVIAHNPRVLRRMRRGSLLDEGAISVRQRELVILRTTAKCSCEYEWGVHAAFFGAAAELTEGEIAATVGQDIDAVAWSADERVILRICDELADTKTVSDSTWAEAVSQLNSEQLIEVLMVAGLYHAVSFVANGTQVAREAFAPRFPGA